jgi:hypothetical protein
VSASGPVRSGAHAAAVAGTAMAFVTGVNAVRALRPGLLGDPEPSFAPYRLVLALAVAALAAAAGVFAAGLLFLCSRSPALAGALDALPCSGKAIAALAVAAFVAGTALRFAALSRLPEWLWIDDVSLIDPALALTGGAGDFADAVRPVPFGVAKLYGSVGVLYLEGFRLALRLCGTTVFGLRLPSALAGAVSLLTAGLLGRALLPRGGGALAVLALAGMRWQLILSRWSWNMIVLAPIVDVAALLLLRARRRPAAWAALAAGGAAGLGAHVYLSAWIAGVALGLFALLPARGEPRRASLLRALLFAAGFAAAAAPLFLLREGRPASYFARVSDHNLIVEIQRTHSLLPAAAAAADALAAPWRLPDPSPRHDLPETSRLGFLLGIPVALALMRALLHPREDISALLLSHGVAAFAATVAGGQAGIPNGSRFGYLTTLTAVATAAGFLALLRLAPAARRREAVLVGFGLLALAGVLGARDALARWPERPETFVGFHGADTLIARAALRWEGLGTVRVAPGIGHSDVTISAIRRYHLDPDAGSEPAGAVRLDSRVAPPSTPAGAGERLVERVSDPWGREWAVVLARRR